MTQTSFHGDLREVPVSVLAYVGDAVYELAVRLRVCGQSAAKSGVLHRRSVQMVRAAAQAAALQKLVPVLTDEENTICRRGRNSQPGSKPKNADPADYLAATGFEALIGYLYLKGDAGRLDELLAIVLEERSHGKEE
jgi:ribonuclease III family protein